MPGGDSGPLKVSQAPDWRESFRLASVSPCGSGPCTVVPRRWSHVVGGPPWHALWKSHSVFALSLPPCCLLPPYLRFSAALMVSRSFSSTQHWEQRGLLLVLARRVGWHLVGVCVDLAIASDSRKLLRTGSESAGPFVPGTLSFLSQSSPDYLVGLVCVSLKWVLRGLFWPQRDSRVPQ